MKVKERIHRKEEMSSCNVEDENCMKIKTRAQRQAAAFSILFYHSFHAAVFLHTKCPGVKRQACQKLEKENKGMRFQNISETTLHLKRKISSG